MTALIKHKMNTVALTINGQKIVARNGANLLWTALDNGVYIPNLCAMREKKEPEAACRLCWVEIAGRKNLAAACTETVAEGMVVNTKAEKALALAQAGFELLMASHPVDCIHCPAHGSCELQNIARVLKCSLKPKRFRKLLRNLPIDTSNPLFTYDPNKCVVCGRCVWVCRTEIKCDVLGFAHRGFMRRVTTFDDLPIGETCLNCSRCVEVCPTGALSFRDKSKLKTQSAKPQLIS